MVTIDTGHVSADTDPGKIPENKWVSLLIERSRVLNIRLPYDCRSLLRYIDEAKKFKMWEKCGYKNLDDLIRRGLELDPELAHWAYDGLKALDPKEATSYEHMVKVGKVLGKHGGNRKGDYQVGDTNLNASKGGMTKEYQIARLKRDHPDIAQDLADGKYPSVRQAAIAAGIVKVKTPLEQIMGLLKKLNSNELNVVLGKINEMV